MGNATDGLLGVHIDRDTSDAPLADDHNELARWLTVICRTLIGGPLEEGFLHGGHPTIDTTTGRVSAGTLIGFAGGRPIYMTSELEKSSSAANGTTTSLTDSNLYGEDDFWVGAWVTFTSGSNSGESRQITGYDSATATLSWDTPLSNSVSTGDGYVVSFFYVQDILVDGTRYVFARSLQKTIYYAAGSPSPVYAPAEFVARSSSTPASGEVLIATVTVSGGSITAATAAGNKLYSHMGQWTQLSGSGTALSVPPGSYIDVTISHDQLAQLGGITVSCDSPHTITVIEHWKDDEFKVRITNEDSYSRDINFTWTRAGRLLE